mmetsp:Transcript_64990/g.205323  ORF Transcript_64990/g.205323 Transcript_64990/m.205323 type:complete len:716 (+) Transcript_64990:3-2150(+)
MSLHGPFARALRACRRSVNVHARGVLRRLLLLCLLLGLGGLLGLGLVLGRLFLLWRGRRRLRLLQDLICHLCEILVLLLHVCTQQHRLLVLGKGLLLCLGVLEPVLKLVAGSQDLGELVGRDVSILLTRLLCGRTVVLDRPCHSVDPLAPHAVLLVAPSYGVAHDLQLLKLLNVLGLGGVWAVVKPVLGCRKSTAEGIAVRVRDKGPVLAALCDLVTHVEDVCLDVVALLVGLNDLTHLRLHRKLLILQFLHGVLAQAGPAGCGDAEVSLLGAAFLLHHVDPLVPLLGRPLFGHLDVCLLLLGVCLSGLRLVHLLVLLVLVGLPLVGHLGVAIGILLRLLARRRLLLSLLRCCAVFLFLLRLALALRWFLGIWGELSLLLDTLLVLLLLQHLRALDVEGSVQGQPRLDLDLLGLRLCWQLDLESAKLLRRAGQQRLLVGELGLHVEGSGPVECQQFQLVHGRADREDRGGLVLALPAGHLRVAVVLLCSGGVRGAPQPADVHREEARVLHLKVPDLVQRRQDRCLQSAASRHALLLVHRRGEIFPAEGLGADSLDPGHAGRTAHDLHGVDLVHRHLRLGNHGRQERLGPGDRRLTHLLEIGARDGAGKVLVFHQAFHCAACFIVCGEDLLRLGDCVLQLERRLLVGQRIASGLLLELRRELPDEALVHVATSDELRPLADDAQPPPHELHDGHGEESVAHRAKRHRHRLVGIEVI